MARRRLAPLPDCRSRTFRARNISRIAPPRPGPALAAPIARVAAEAAGAAALQELADTLARARETGRLVLDLPLDAIAPDHLARDRLPAEDEEMARPARVPARPRPAHADRGRRRSTGALPYGLHLRLAPPPGAEGAPRRDRRAALRHRPGAGPPPGDRRRRLRHHGRGERDPPRPQPLRARPRRRPRHRPRRLRRRGDGAARALRHRQPPEALAHPRLPRALPRPRRRTCASPPTSPSASASPSSSGCARAGGPAIAAALARPRRKPPRPSWRCSPASPGPASAAPGRRSAVAPPPVRGLAPGLTLETRLEGPAPDADADGQGGRPRPRGPRRGGSRRGARPGRGRVAAQSRFRSGTTVVSSGSAAATSSR